LNNLLDQANDLSVRNGGDFFFNVGVGDN